ncbi:hypothetical protein FQR65_LT10593 [Abscondita terminalis]|nr:hypothetical protein FQR65_LT10593 [Abscondita terminalis]
MPSTSCHSDCYVFCESAKPIIVVKMTDDSWRTATFRQSVVSKIDEAIRQSRMPTSKNSIEMENHVFQKAKTKEEYLGFVARLILHVREMIVEKGSTFQESIRQKINCVENVSINLMVNVNAKFTSCSDEAIRQSRMPTSKNSIEMENHVFQKAKTKEEYLGFVARLILHVREMSSGNMQSALTGAMNSGNQMPNQLQNQMSNQLPNPMLGQLPQMQRKTSDNMMMKTPTQFLRQSPTPSVQSPASLTGPQSNNQMVASPALVHSPSSQMSLISGPQRSAGMAPSPSSSLNTPGQPGPSPMGMQEDQAYREKVRQLSKYIEPLRKMIAKMGNDDVEKLSKMKKLLEILSNPSQRMPLETLMKCEVVLEKLDFKRGDGSVAPPAQSVTFKEHHCFNPLLEAVNNNLQSSVINHTLQRTFGPTLEALFGPEIRLVPPLKRKRVEEPQNEIPDVLQGEIARLDQRFKVSLDPCQQPGSKSIQLICCLDDKYLPCVPPVSIVIPEDYPKSSPKCYMAPHEYNATNFLSAVQNALLARIKKLPKHFSVSQLLDTWEMSVRQASAPSHVPVSATTLLMGL